jgi:DNA-binding NtrC family response regulator
LRDRREDIPALISHFAKQVCAQNNWRSVKFSAEAISSLQDYSWPGNIRELRNMIERLMLLNTGDEVGIETVRLVLGGTDVSAKVRASGTLADQVEEFEREVILAELKQSGFHMTNAAKKLGLERSHLYKKVEQLGIDIRKQRREDEA